MIIARANMAKTPGPGVTEKIRMAAKKARELSIDIRLYPGKFQGILTDKGSSAHDILSAKIDRGRKNLYLRFTDPVTGQKIEKSSGTSKKRDANKRAGEWEAELRSGIVGKVDRLKWPAFREEYQQYVDATLATGTSEKVFTTFNVIEDFMKPDRANRITAQWVTRF